MNEERNKTNKIDEETWKHGSKHMNPFCSQAAPASSNSPSSARACPKCRLALAESVSRRQEPRDGRQWPQARPRLRAILPQRDYFVLLVSSLPSKYRFPTLKKSPAVGTSFKLPGRNTSSHICPTPACRGHCIMQHAGPNRAQRQVAEQFRHLQGKQLFQSSASVTRTPNKNWISK